MERRAGHQGQWPRNQQGRSSRRDTALEPWPLPGVWGRALRPVDGVGVVFVQVVDAVFQLVAVMALVNAEDEEDNVGIQRELVHGVHATHVIEHEEQ